MSEKYNFALIGKPAHHSKSPNIYAKLFKEHGIDGSFTVLELDRLDNILSYATKYDLCAFAVTMPYKYAIIEHLNSISPAADALQSVNFVTVQKGRLQGYSTDGEGFIMALSQRGVRVTGKKVLVYGTGGASSAVCYALQAAGADVFVTGRNLGKAENMSRRFGIGQGKGLDLRGYDIFVNATPLGMTGCEQFESLDFLNTAKADMLICDLIYSPQETELLKTAGKLGLRTENGLGMLNMQARVAFELIYNK